MIIKWLNFYEGNQVLFLVVAVNIARSILEILWPKVSQRYSLPLLIDTTSLYLFFPSNILVFNTFFEKNSKHLWCDLWSQWRISTYYVAPLLASWALTKVCFWIQKNEATDVVLNYTKVARLDVLSRKLGAQLTFLAYFQSV